MTLVEKVLTFVLGEETLQPPPRRQSRQWTAVNVPNRIPPKPYDSELASRNARLYLATEDNVGRLERLAREAEEYGETYMTVGFAKGTLGSRKIRPGEYHALIKERLEELK